MYSKYCVMLVTRDTKNNVSGVIDFKPDTAYLHSIQFKIICIALFTIQSLQSNLRKLSF